MVEVKDVLDMLPRRYTLGQITGAMGEALKALEARGIKLDDRSVRLFVDAVTDALKAAPR